MIKILHKINEFRKNMLLILGYYLVKKYGDLDIIEVGNILNKTLTTLKSLEEAAQRFNKAAQRFREASRG